MTAQLRPTPSGAAYFCPGCDRPLVRDDIHVRAGVLVVELLALGCSARYALRIEPDGALTVNATRPCIESPLPLFPEC